MLVFFVLFLTFVKWEFFFKTTSFFCLCTLVSLGLLLLINVQCAILISDDNTRKCTVYSLLDKCAHR